MLGGPIAGIYVLSRSGYTGQLVAVSAGIRPVGGNRDLCDTVRRCLGGADADAISPQAHAAQI
jgi:hypothetical protein